MKLVGLWLALFVLALAVSVGVDLFLWGRADHALFRWSHLPGFFALFGFFGCVIIVVVSKFLGKTWLQRPENYYDRDAE